MALKNIEELEWSLFFGCLLIAFGPLIAFFFWIVTKRAQLVIITITSAFIWLLAILVTSTIWFIIPPLKKSIYATVPLSVLIQEIFRAFLFFGYVKAEKAIQKVSTPTSKLPLNDITSSFAAGIGFAAMQASMIYGSILASSLNGRGAGYSDSCPSLPIIFVYALLTLAFVLMNISLMMIAFEGYRKGSTFIITFVIGIHMICSLSTLFNTTENGCVTSIPLAFLSSFIAVAACVYNLRNQNINIRLQ